MLNPLASIDWLIPLHVRKTVSQTTTQSACSSAICLHHSVVHGIAGQQEQLINKLHTYTVDML